MNPTFNGQAQWLLNALLTHLHLQRPQPQGPPAHLAMNFPQMVPLQPVGLPNALPPWIQQAALQQWFQQQLQAMGLIPQQYQPPIAGPVQGQLLQDILDAIQMQLGDLKNVKKEEMGDLDPADLQAIVHAIKKRWQDGSVARLQIFDELSIGSDRTAIDWMRMFIANMDKVFAQVDADTSSGPTNDVAPATSAGGSLVSDVRESQGDITRHNIVTRSKTGFSTPKRAAHQSLRYELLPVRSLPSAETSKKEGQEPIFHDVTFIPPSDGSEKPRLPRLRSSAADPNEKFTDDEKVFFVHWLRWRLRQGPLPDKDELFEELQTELPHRTASMWKSHWEDHPELPDQIYLAAKERAEKEENWGIFPTKVAALNEPLILESESEDDGDDGRSDPSYSDRNGPIPTLSPLPRARKSKHNVSDAELRAMALYKFEHAAKWENNTRKYPLWRDFANSPENIHKRTSEEWRGIAMNRKYANIIRRYVEEHRAHANVAKDVKTMSANKDTVTHSALPASSRSAASPVGPATQLEGGKRAKRPANLGGTSKDWTEEDQLSPKRMKMGLAPKKKQVVWIDLTDDAD
ncbi:hypothetical protein BD311DRAFT_792402 [Dichomitus squalens]|uniref:Uncharacterized protein n=1 Tax=Dichomitus squalens TaxID=114155 RepID=A0A4Q9M6U9_9APHY|nr:hypothetical protein BD311DRAFT_792402 [Dichomitus squalens]